MANGLLGKGTVAPATSTKIYTAPTNVAFVTVTIKVVAQAGDNNANALHKIYTTTSDVTAGASFPNDGSLSDVFKFQEAGAYESVCVVLSAGERVYVKNENDAGGATFSVQVRGLEQM